MPTSIFDNKIFNAEVFGGYVDRVPNLLQLNLIKSKALRERTDLKQAMADQTGSYIITTPMKGLISGQSALNYDGKTDITAEGTKTFKQSRVVTGRAKAWIENDFSFDITGGVDFMGNIANQVAGWWQEIDQKTLISTFKGCFNMKGADNLKFVNNHTVDITADTANSGKIGATTINSAMQKALGANKGKFALVVMHSVISTNLENLKLLEYMKYTDAEGITRNLNLGTIHGRLVLVDDGLPTKDVYVKCATGDLGSLEVVADAANPTATQIKLSSVTPVNNGVTIVVGDHVKLATVYTTYILGEGAIEFTNAGVKVPYETYRDPKTNGGQDTLYTRQRKCFSPYGISFTNKSMASLSPTDAELENGDNWELVNSQGETKEYINHQAIPMAQLFSLG